MHLTARLALAYDQPPFAVLATERFGGNSAPWFTQGLMIMATQIILEATGPDFETQGKNTVSGN
jgi:hypothetical protein